MNTTNLSFQGTPNVTDIDSDSQNITIQDGGLEEAGPMRRKKYKLSQYGIPYPSLPAGVIKKLAITFAKTAGNRKPKINKETLDALMQATDWFFEQASDDLRAYAMHAGRKTIDESDVTTLMKRQRQINSTTTPFFLAQRYLPRELIQELRMTTNSSMK
ncbi:Inner kinetochore subunit cnp20 [Erysiphe neolycopersici]|uniref:Inner kinetochore subunit cnp20 n=1 Tax=Erysiphe neolycopersici TaxID=212602 RepID=A0A420HWD2_9PEZI|nr:Inner kinetochore subunit cnp20 [Erysiphe neolycopersici]